MLFQEGIRSLFNHFVGLSLEELSPKCKLLAANMQPRKMWTLQWR